MGMKITWSGVDRLEGRLKGLQGAPLTKTAKKAFVRGGRKVVPTLKSFAPKGATRNLERAMSSRQGRRGIAALVGPRKRKAPHRHLVARGTKPHLIRAKDGGALRFGGQLRPFVRHPGAKSNDYVSRSWKAKRAEALAEISRFLVTESAKERGR